ncbi:MAG: hypothetical protein EOP50_06170 [Sphingobacteriales bacterium]|nr:MAG: hypothetical protein EOP50_06170 [Sphingobacteriales bacterium]
MKYLFLPVLCLLTLLSPAQEPNLNGIWKGTLTQTAGGCFPKYYIELQIDILGDTAAGASYHYSDITNYVKKKFRGTYYPNVRKLYISEGPVQTFKIPADCIPCIKNYELWYSRTGNVETLRGEWTGKVMGSEGTCQPGQLTLTRVKESAFAEIPEIEVDTGMIRLDFYDNGEIDGDSISVRVNGKTILTNKKLDLAPVTAFVHIDRQNTFQEVEMVAENLGRIPPNTALLIVMAGGKRYKLYLTSTESKSAKVRFVYDPPK